MTQEYPQDRSNNDDGLFDTQLTTQYKLYVASQLEVNAREYSFP